MIKDPLMYRNLQTSFDLVDQRLKQMYPPTNIASYEKTTYHCLCSDRPSSTFSNEPNA